MAMYSHHPPDIQPATMVPAVYSPYTARNDEYEYEADGVSIDLTQLPLNLLALVIYFISDPADLARVCRTCRKLYYMCLPNLYTHVRLKSYDHIRYSSETARPEGCGGGSPFAMGLTALINRPVAHYVKSFEVAGVYKEIGAENYAKVGRVSDGSMMLNMMVRIAIERMPVLESFTWNLNVKMLSVTWDVLASKQTLTSLTIKCPTDRIPSPIHTAPGMPNLKSLTITDIDPLCFPDNFQTMLHESLGIEHLKMHWSPRMRRERDPSVNANVYFGRIYASDKKMRLKTLGIQNLYCLGHEGSLLGIYQPNYLETMTAIDATGGADDEGNMVFVAEPPKRLAPMPKIRLLRGNKVSSSHCARLTKLPPLKEYYLISGRDMKDLETPSSSRAGSIASPGSTISNSHRGSLYDGSRSVGGTPQSIPDTKSSPGSTSHVFNSASTPVTVGSPDAPVIALSRQYLDTIFRYHGRSLTRLLLLPQWRLTVDDIRQLTSSCIAMQQLGIGVQNASFEVLQFIVPNMPHLRALRILDAPKEWGQVDGMAEMDGAEDEWYEEKISDQTWQSGWDEVRWLGLGSMVFELLGQEKVKSRRYSNASEDSANEMDADSNQRRRVVRRPLIAVKEVEIWKMDRKQLVV